MVWHPRKPLAKTLLGIGTALLSGVFLTGTTPAQARAPLPVDYSFVSGFAKGLAFPTTSPPGANDFGCRPSAAHPTPVVLVHGTFENMNDNWQGASPLLANHGYCVFAFNYGGSGPIRGLGDIPAAAGELSAFVDRVLSATGASKVDLVGHSQGGMMPRYYLKSLGGAGKVGKLIGLAPSNHGTTIDGLVTFARLLGVGGLVDVVLGSGCPACVQQEKGSDFITSLGAGGDTVPGVTYTVIESREDEVVTPYTSAYLTGSHVTNLTIDDQCAIDKTDHLEIAYDPTALADTLNALDPAHPVQVPCVPVTPVIGPVGPVPAF